MSDKLEELKAIADEIAPGYRQKWGYEDGTNDDSISVGTYNDDGDICPFIDVSISDWSGNDDDNEKLAKFITLANPPVVSELLAALERSTKNEHALGGLLDEMTRRRDSHANRANAAEQREGHLKASVDVLSAKNAELERRLQQSIKLPPLMPEDIFAMTPQRHMVANAHNNAITACSMSIRDAGFKSECTVWDATKVEG